MSLDKSNATNPRGLAEGDVIAIRPQELNNKFETAIEKVAGMIAAEARTRRELNDKVQLEQC